MNVFELDETLLQDHERFARSSAQIRAQPDNQPAPAQSALANSQREEIEKFIKRAGLPDHLRPTFARYTGQESSEEPERIRESKPDILPTNFMMLELLMTRQNPLDRAVTQTGTTGVS